MARGVVQTYFLLSQIAEIKKDFKEAQAYLARIKSAPDAAKIQLRRALLLGKQGQWDEARTLIRNLPETQADDSRFKINAELQLLREHHQDRQAYRLITEALQRFPGDPDFTYELAMSADKLGRSSEMEKILRALIAAKPDYYAAYNALGYALADRNTQLDEARTLINKALEYAPKDPFILDSLAWLEFRSGNLPLALSILEKAFQARPDAEIAAHLGEVHWSLNQREQAQRIWKQGLELNRDNETLKSTIRRLPGKL
jgi:Flp pilus assembly protein TadD